MIGNVFLCYLHHCSHYNKKKYIIIYLGKGLMEERERKKDGVEGFGDSGFYWDLGIIIFVGNWARLFRKDR